MRGRFLALAASLSMGAPVPPASASVIWVELCATGRSGARVPLPVHREGEKNGPAKACHAACASLGERRQRLRGRR